MKSKVLTYSGDDITVTYDAARCIHAATCVKRLPAVFDVAKKPWVQPNEGAADDVATVTARCPTGALHAERGGKRAENAPEVNEIRIVADGPVYVRGDVTLKTMDGDVLLEDTRMALCRCGAAENKPLCDNSHVDTSFQDGAALGKAAGDSRGSAAGGKLTITAAPNGPLLLDGPFEIRGADGSNHAAQKAALCRCGLSKNKPYCDGSHSVGAFKAD